jgi:DNA repair protein RecO (recombination protein O)
MLIKTRGIVFRHLKYSETSVITDIFTEEAGLITFIVSGVRTPKAKISANLLQVGSLVELVAYHQPEKSINRLKEIQAGYIYSSLPFDVHKSSIGIFMLEVARRAIREQEANPPLFQYLWDIFTFLDAEKSAYANLHLSYLAHLTHYLGFMPTDDAGKNGIVFDMKEGLFIENGGNQYVMSPQMTYIFRGLLRYDWRESYLINGLTRETRRLMLQDLLTFYRLQIDNFPEIQSMKIYQEIFD